LGNPFYHWATILKKQHFLIFLILKIMKKQFIILILGFFCNLTFAQKGVRIGYIDMDYILENTPSYSEAKNQLELKAQKWKQEMEVKKTEISKLREVLISEKVLLTKELIEERETEIKTQETALAEFQEKKFGPLGELVVQKTLLVQPIQDQVFNIIQDVAEAKRYDFIFDKSSDLTMLFASKRFDISEYVVRKMKNITKGEQLTKKQQKAADEKEKLLDQIDENPALAEREKALARSQEARQKLIDDKKAAAELRKKEAADKRQKAIDERNAAKLGTISVSDKKEDKTADDKNKTAKPEPTANNAEIAKKDPAQILAERQAAKALDLANRKKALEDKKAKDLADREAAKKAREDAKIKK
jgi:Skp family chaperone for outer membrane proteins